MSTETRAIYRHSRAYAAGSFVSLSAGLVVVWVLTHRLPPGEYGVLGVLMVTSEIVGAVVGLKLGTAMSRLYFDEAEDRARAEVVSTALLAVLASAVGACLLISPAAEPLARLLLGGAGRGGLLMLAVCGMMINTLTTVALQYVQVRQRSGLFLAITAARAAIHVCLTVILVWGLGLGLEGALWALLATNAVIGAGVVIPLLAAVGVRFSRPALARMTRFAMPMLPAQLVEILMVFADRLLVTRLASLAAAGELFLGVRVGSLLNAMLVVPFGRTYLVRRFQAHGQGSRDGHAARVFTYFFAVMVTAALALSLLAPEVVHVLAGKRYHAAAIVIPFVALSQVLLSLLIILELGIYYTKRSVYFMYISAATLAVHIALVAIFVPSYGAAGAAGAGCLSTAVRIAITAPLVRRLNGPVPEWGRLAVVLAAAAAAWGLGQALRAADGVPGLAWRTLALVAFPLLLFASPLFSRQERVRVIVTVRRAARRATARRRRPAGLAT